METSHENIQIIFPLGKSTKERKGLKISARNSNPGGRSERSGAGGCGSARPPLQLSPRLDDPRPQTPEKVKRDRRTNQA